MQSPNLITKAFTLTFFFILISCFIAYRAGAFDRWTAGRPAQSIALASGNPIDTPEGVISSELMSRSSYTLPKPATHGDSAAIRLRLDSAQAAHHRIMMSSSKSMAVFPARNSDSVQPKKKANAPKVNQQQQNAPQR